jgi:hypothetical protein
VLLRRLWGCVLAAVAACAAFLALHVVPPEAATDAWPGCDAFASQPQAQAWWERHGTPAAADGDADGIVCEALPATPKADSSPAGSSTTSPTRCVRTRKVVAVGLSKTKYPNVLAHAHRAIAEGWPAVLVINRVGADERRNRLLAGIPTRDSMDRDEYPPAMGRGKGEGLQRGRHPTGWKADVEYVPSSENRGAGSVLGIKLRRYCNGVRFRYVGY